MRSTVFRVVCFSILILGICTFGLYKSFAASAPFAIDGVEVTQKSDTATGDVTGVVGNRINNNVTFHKVGDSVTYKIKIKNVSGGDRIIENVNSNYQGELFAYEFNSYAGDTIAADETFDFVLKTTYANAVSDVTKRQQNLEIKFVFKFSDGSEMTIVIANPSTWDNISVFGVIFAACIIGLLAVVVLRCRRMNPSKKVVISAILLAIACVPFPFVNAADGTYDVAIANNYTLEDELLVRFIGKDGNNEVATETITYEDVATPIAAPDIEGYYFDGWKTEAGETYDFSTPITEDLALYAAYAPYTYTVQFNGNGATSGTMGAQTLTYDTAENLAKNKFERVGYNFAGWGVAANSTTDLLADENEVLNLRNESGVYNLYAIWTPRNDTKYVIRKSLMTVDGDAYVSMPDEVKTGTSDADIVPVLENIAGFITPTATPIHIDPDGSTVAEYKYNRRQVRLTITNSEYVQTETPSGLYNYGTEITLKQLDKVDWVFDKWSNGNTDEEIHLTLIGDLTIGPEYTEHPFSVKFSQKGQCQFNGIYTNQADVMTEADNMTGDECTAYHDKKFIDTGLKLFSSDNIGKDFLVTLTVDEFDTDVNGHRGTLVSDTSEIASIQWPGFNIRRNDHKGTFQIGSNITKYTNDDHTTTARFDSKKITTNIANNTTFKIMRKNDAICYQVNDGPVVYLHTQPENVYPFDTPLYFGSSYEWINNKRTPLRFINAKMSNMTVRLGEDVDDMLADCHE